MASDGFLRIEGPAPFLPAQVRRRGGLDRAGHYLDRLVKMIPGEILALYPAEKVLKLDNPWPGCRVWPLVCLVALIVFRTKATAKAGTWRPQITPLFVSIGSFILWIYMIGDYFIYWPLQGAATVFVGYASLLWPIIWSGFVAGDNDNERPPTD